MKITDLNSLSLAYLGDAIYELKIREYLLQQKIAKINDLQKASLNFVTAKRQAYFLDELIKQNFFNEKEIEIIKTARNSKTHSKPKNCDILTYKHATALEAVIGYFYIEEKFEKIDSLINEIMKL